MNRYIIIFVILFGCEHNKNVKKNLDLTSVEIISVTSQTEFECDYFGEEPPKDIPKLFAPNYFGTTDFHGSLNFSLNGKEVYYNRLETNGTYSGVLARYFNNGKWSNPVKVKGTDWALTPSLSPDGKRLYCAIKQRLKVLERTNSGWSQPIDLGNVINFQKRQDGLSESRDGTLFFTTMFGTNDGTYYTKLENNEYRRAYKLETGLPSKAGGYPFVAPDESYVILQSRSNRGYGASDLYIMFKKKNGQWSKAINLGPKINTKDNESFPYVTPDGKYFFFNSNRVSEVNGRIPEHFYGNIYWVSTSFINDLKKKHQY